MTIAGARSRTERHFPCAFISRRCRGSSEDLDGGNLSTVQKLVHGRAFSGDPEQEQLFRADHARAGNAPGGIATASPERTADHRRAYMIMQHGLQKWFGIPGPDPTFANIRLLSLIGIAGVIEITAGALVTIGLRCAAFILSGEMAVAYFWAHAPRGFAPIVNGGTLAGLYCFVVPRFCRRRPMEP